MEFQGQHTLEDVLICQRLHNRKMVSWWIHTLRWFAIGAIVGLTLALSRVKSPTLIIGCLVFVVSIVAYYFTMSSQTRRRIARQHLLFLPFRSRIDESGFETHFGKDTNHCSWNEFTGWLENGQYFVLIENVGFRVIPKQVFDNTDQVTQLRTILQKNLGNAD